MLAALIVWSSLGALLYLYGSSSLQILRRWLGNQGDEPVPLCIFLVVGLIVFATFATVLSLFMPLAAVAAGILAAGGAALFLVVRPAWTRNPNQPGRRDWLAACILLLVGLVVLENATHATSNPDTNLYHAQTIHWIESFRAVPGLGNLNGRFAYNSDWLVLNAATSFAFLGLRSFHLLAGLLFLLVSGFFVSGVQGLLHERARVSDWLKVLFLPLSLWVLRGELSSPGTDLPVILLTWLLMALAAEHIESRGSETLRGLDVSSWRAVVPGILPAFIVTLKLSAAPLLLLTLYICYVMLRQGARRAAAAVAMASLLILAPWVARSAILSGYLVFPISGLDVFAFDWKMPASYVNAVRNGVIGWARLPNKDWTAAVRTPLWSWLPAWFGEQTLNQRLMIAAAVLSPAVLLTKEMRRYAAPMLINYAGIVFWIFSAPNLRFGYGFLLGAVAFILAAVPVFLLSRLDERWRRNAARITSAVLALFLAVMLASSFDAASFAQRLVLPADYARFKTEPCAAGDQQLHCATAYKQCGYEPFPCVPNMPARVVPRGDDLQDGYLSLK